MNYRMIIYILGWVLKLEGFFLSLPCIVALIYQEHTGLAYLITMVICLSLGFLLSRKKPANETFFSREGFASVSLSWIVISLFGALPYCISGEIPAYGDALFEAVAGFTTTGASTLENVEILSRCSLFWESFTHWIGGMGVLVFVLAVLPTRGGAHVYLMRAETPGPAVSKLVPKIKSTAKILYAIYVGITLLEMILLMVGGMPVFDAVTTAFGTAGTGGFAIKNDGMASYSTYHQVIVTIFMILCGISFNAYYFIICRKIKNVLRMEEIRAYLLIILISVLLIACDIRKLFPDMLTAVQQAAFQVASMITSTGFTTANYNLWPEFSKMLLLLLMFTGPCAGSTGGGIKVSRILLLAKTIKKEILTVIHPRSIKKIKMDGHMVEHEVVRATNVFFIAYVFIFVISLLFISTDNFDFNMNFSAVTSVMNNTGQGLSLIGPDGSYGVFSWFSKFTLMAGMLIGRLEIFPILILFSKRTWTR